MKKNKVRNIILSLSTLSAIILCYPLFLNDSNSVTNVAEQEASISGVTTDFDKADMAPAPKAKSLATQNENLNAPVPDALENPFFEAETKARLIQIADTFADDIQYPDYSKPIRHPSELEKYLPNKSVEASLPLDSKDESSPRISIKASKHQYFRGETIISEALVEGLSADQRVEVSGRIVNLGAVLSETEAEPTDATYQRFQLSFQPESIPSLAGAGELRLIARFNIDQKPYEIGTPVQYVHSVASVDYVSDAQVNDTFLEIPVYITTYQPGYHQISANLYDAETGQALVHLSAEKELLVEKDVILLKAHIAALKAAEHEGPYELKDLTLTRMPSPPNFSTEFGTVPDEAISLSGFPFEDYRDEPYVDEEAQDRLEFLSKLGG